MQTRISYRRGVVMPIVQACALGFLFWACSSSSSQDAVVLSYSCATPPADLATCSVDADCATFAVGCYCGMQPVNGVASKYAATAQSCEETAAGACALGCANQPGMVAQDGTKAVVGTRLAAHCDHSGATAICKSFVPPAGGGSGDPTPGGW
jgi:hypothetical protein